MLPKAWLSQGLELSYCGGKYWTQFKALMVDQSGQELPCLRVEIATLRVSARAKEGEE